MVPHRLETCHTPLCSIVSNAFLKSVVPTHSGWCHSVALCLSCWNVNKRSVVEKPSLTPAWSVASGMGCRRLKRSWLNSLFKMGIDQMGRQFDGGDGCPLLRVTLIVVSRQFGGGCLLYNRSRFFLSLLVDWSNISTLTPLLSATLPLSEVVDGFVDFLHRGRRHRVLWLVAAVLVFVSSSLRCRTGTTRSTTLTHGLKT